MSTATRDIILQRCASGRRRTSFEHPTMGVVHLQSISEHERLKVEGMKVSRGLAWDADGFARTTAMLAVYMVTDEEGRRLFTEEDAERIAEMDARDMVPLREHMNAHADVASELDEDAAKND